MKRKYLMILLLLLCFLFIGCGEKDPCKEHVDENNDHICDVCGEKIVEVCKEHVDENKDGLCDVCGVEIPKEKEWTENELFWDADKNGVEDWTEKQITLKYATWQYNDPEATTIDVLMIQEFMKKYPNIKVEMQIVGESAVWDESFLALLETESIPDVFLVNRLENFLPYGIMADITDFYNHDEDTEYIFDSVKDLGLYKEKRYVIPTYIYPQLWVLNLDLLEAANIDKPSYNWTWEQMESIAKAVSNTTTHTIGCYKTGQYCYEYPKVLKTRSDNNVGSKWLAYGFDGNNFNFMDDSFLQAMNAMTTGLNEGWLVNLYDETQLLEYYGDGAIDPRYAGYVGLWRQPSWEFKDYMDDLQFSWDVYPSPSGINGGNTDIAGVSSFCENKAAAYQLLKWMSYSNEGLVTRYRLYQEYSDELYVSANNYPYPVVDYGINGQGVNEIWDNIPYGKTAAGFTSPEFIEGLRNGAIQANKEIIGWDAADTAINEYLYQIIMGESDFATLREAMQTAAMKALNDKRAAVDELLSQLGK